MIMRNWVETRKAIVQPCQTVFSINNFYVWSSKVLNTRPRMCEMTTLRNLILVKYLEGLLTGSWSLSKSRIAKWFDTVETCWLLIQVTVDISVDNWGRNDCMYIQCEGLVDSRHFCLGTGYRIWTKVVWFTVIHRSFLAPPRGPANQLQISRVN